MIKTAFSFFIFFQISIVFCQDSNSDQNEMTLSVDMIEPRVNQSFHLLFQSNFLSEAIMSQVDSSVSFNPLYPGFISVRGDIWSEYSIELKIDTPGAHIIGPFNFSFNGKEYSTDSILVNILPRLPSKEGVWVREVRDDGGKYLIIEQLIKPKRGKQTIKVNPGEVMGQVPSPMPDTSKIAELIFGSMPVGLFKDKDYSDSSYEYFKYSYQSYYIQRYDHNGPILIEEKHFRNFPDNIVFKPFELVLAP